MCPPYDVITEEQRQALLEPQPLQRRAGGAARRRLRRGGASCSTSGGPTGALAVEDGPALYGYRMTYRAPDGQTRHTLGVMGALVLEPPGQGILPHEHTTPKAKSDRLELIRATRCNTSPIWCLCSEPGLAQALALAGPDGARGRRGWRRAPRPCPCPRPPVPQTTTAPSTSCGRSSRLASTRRWRRSSAPRPLLVADGHHRYETALTYQAEQRRQAAAPARAPAGYDAVLCYVVELAEEHLQVLAIHRVVSGLPAGTDMLGALAPAFELTPTDVQGGRSRWPAWPHARALAVVTRDGTYLAFPRAERPAAGADPRLRPGRRRHRKPPRPPAHLRARRPGGPGRGQFRCGRLAILCRPAGIDQIARTAHGGERMPPKTTFFWPKLRTGMVLRDLERPRTAET